ncbi:MAG: serine/threonine protein kinase, partial [Planctomycetales bacterium]|nr:serine/threonine protein kinase [Planctomycetales bacterium]
MSNCLAPNEIEKYVAGMLSDVDQHVARQHVESCQQCQLAVEQEKLFGDLREVFDRNASLSQNETGSPISVALQKTLALPEDLFLAAGYRIIREIHRGGQGIVYCAMQLATKRTVALKILLAGVTASDTQRLRFEREIDIAASLRHPNIVTVYDSGDYCGQQYLAMEFIDGLPLDQFLRSRKQNEGMRKARSTSLRERLLLFLKIAGAVGYAHTRGVMHRDLKPANIIIDGDGEPHVLDFGLAKLSEPGIQIAHYGEKGHPTVHGEFLGTLAYASPEQTHGDPQQIDIRSDVYSLGVILFEVLTGELPYEVSGSMSEALANICNVPPKRPSRLSSDVDDEVETILLKALSKEPARRYQSAEHLCRDISHYLANEPIDAKRDSAWYVLRKSLIRYRWVLAIAASFFVLLTVSFIVTLAALQKAIAQRNIATIAEDVAERARANELMQRIEAEEQRKEADSQRAEAQRQTAQAQAQRREAEFQSYVANLGAAAGAIERLDVVEASTRLQAAPGRFRGW